MQKHIGFLAMFLAFNCTSILARNAILFPNGSSMDKIANLSETKGISDTLKPSFVTPFYSTWGPFREEYEAIKFTPQSPCSVVEIWHGVYSDKASSKNCSLFIWNDASGTPGSWIYRSQTPAMTTGAGSAWNKQPVSPPVYINGPFWVGNREMDTLLPTTIVDTIPSVPVKYNYGTGWEDDIVDYFHVVVVKYDDSVTTRAKRVIVFEEFIGTG